MRGRLSSERLDVVLPLGWCDVRVLAPREGRLSLGQQFLGVGPAQELVMQRGERLQAEVQATTQQAHASRR